MASCPAGIDVQIVLGRQPRTPLGQPIGPRTQPRLVVGCHGGRPCRHLALWHGQRFLAAGWQLDVEGAAFPRLDLQHNEDLTSVDFRGGILSTTRQGPWETKFGFYHISSHLGDEYMLRTSPNYTRLNYVRESLMAGIAAYLNPSVRIYTEAGWAFQEDGGAKPWEFQFGIDCSSPEPTGPGARRSSPSTVTCARKTTLAAM